LAGHDPEKIAGIITRLETVGHDLQIDALLNLNISYSRDLYEAAKQLGGLSFSVGFRLEDFEVVDPKKSKRGETLIVKSGELLEVSIVSFPACAEATMTHVKSAPMFNPATVAACMAQIQRMKDLLHG
jgi:HK97 family phage prohead protease